MEDKFKSRSLPSLEHEYFCLIWQLVKDGELESLEGERKIMGHLMLEHPQYHYFWETPYPFVEHIELEDALEQGKVNPDLHLAIELTVCQQVENQDPPEAAEAYRALVDAGVETHEARHAIGRVFTGMLWEGQQLVNKGHQPDADFYVRRLRPFAKRPLKALKQQVKIWEKGL